MNRIRDFTNTVIYIKKKKYSLSHKFITNILMNSSKI